MLQLTSDRSFVSVAAPLGVAYLWCPAIPKSFQMLAGHNINLFWIFAYYFSIQIILNEEIYINVLIFTDLHKLKLMQWSQGCFAKAITTCDDKHWGSKVLLLLAWFLMPLLFFFFWGLMFIVKCLGCYCQFHCFGLLRLCRPLTGKVVSYILCFCYCWYYCLLLFRVKDTL